MARVITDIISHEELIERIELAEKQSWVLSSEEARETLGDRLRLIISQVEVFSEDFLQDCIRDAVILLKELPKKIQTIVGEAIFTPYQKELNLSSQSITGPQEISIIANLLYFTSVSTLNVSENGLNSESACALARNTTISTLDVSWNNIGAEGASTLARNTTISTLDVRHNRIGAEGALAFIDNPTITKLCVKDIGIGNEVIKQINAMVNRNRQKIITEFKNIVSALGQGLRDSSSDISPHKGFPKEMINCIVNSLADSYGLFASPKLKRDTNKNLYPERDITPQSL